MNRFQIILLLGIIFWIAETWYFGWNWDPKSAAEKFCDAVATLLLFYGMIGDILVGVSFVKKTSITLQPGQKIDDVL